MYISGSEICDAVLYLQSLVMYYICISHISDVVLYLHVSYI